MRDVFCRKGAVYDVIDPGRAPAGACDGEMTAMTARRPGLG